MFRKFRKKLRRRNAPPRPTSSRLSRQSTASGAPLTSDVVHLPRVFVPNETLGRVPLPTCPTIRGYYDLVHEIRYKTVTIQLGLQGGSPSQALKFRVHRDLLCSRSTVLARHFADKRITRREESFGPTRYDADVVPALLSYLYGNEQNAIEVTFGTLRECLLELVSRWELDESFGEFLEQGTEPFQPNSLVEKSVREVLYPTLNESHSIELVGGLSDGSESEEVGEGMGTEIEVEGEGPVPVHAHLEVMIRHSPVICRCLYARCLLRPELVIPASLQSRGVTLERATSTLPRFTFTNLTTPEVQVLVDALYTSPETLNLRLLISGPETRSEDLVSSMERLMVVAEANEMEEIRQCILRTIRLKKTRPAPLTKATSMRIYLNFYSYLDTSEEFEAAVVQDVFQACEGQEIVVRRFIEACSAGRHANESDGTVPGELRRLERLQVGISRANAKIERMLERLGEENVSEHGKTCKELETTGEDIEDSQLRNSNLTTRLAGVPDVGVLHSKITELEGRLSSSKGSGSLDLEDQIAQAKGELITAADQKHRYERQLSESGANMARLVRKKEMLLGKRQMLEQQNVELGHWRIRLEEICARKILVKHNEVGGVEES